MLELISVTLGFGERVLFDKIDWVVPDGARVALVGPNGVGKSTLLKVISGEMEYEKGNIKITKNYITGYLPQDLVELDEIPLMEYIRRKSGLTGYEADMELSHHQMSEFPHDSAQYDEAATRYTDALKHFEHLGGYSFESKAARVLIGLGFREKDFTKNCSDFSGGWKMRVILAHILLLEPDMMLLDEPTNHLDTESMEWLENFLTAYRGTLIAVSHDRRFLDKMMTTTAELSRSHLTIYPGNYGYYLEQKELRKAQLEAEIRKQEEYIDRTTKFIERFRYKASKASQVQSRIKMLDKLDLVEMERTDKFVRINFPEPPKSSYEVIQTEKLSHGYEGIPVLENIDLSILQGEKIALVGVNGAGKSTLSRLLSLREQPNSGKVHWGKRVSMGFFAQESRLNLDYNKTIWEEITSVQTNFKEQELRSLLGAFLFSGDDLKKLVEVLSGGEKSRLSLCKLLLERHNLLILDEPTNHLDMATRDLFQNALMDYKGTLILVSHDRYFLDQLITRVIEIRDKQAISYLGNYSDFLKKREEVAAQAKSNQALLSKKGMTLDNSSKSIKVQGKERKRFEAEQRKTIGEYNKKVLAIEVKINTAEEEKKTIELQLSVPDVYSNPSKVIEFSARVKELEILLPTLYAQWEKAHKELESIKQKLGIE